MRKLALFLFISVLILSCGADREEEPNYSQLMGLWEILYQENLRLPEDDDRRRVDRSEMEVISTLNFSSDGKVTKQVVSPGTMHTATGTYTIQSFSSQEIEGNPNLRDALAIEVTYTITSTGFSASSCGDTVERYDAHSDGLLVNRGWIPCVGVLEVYTKL